MTTMPAPVPGQAAGPCPDGAAAAAPTTPTRGTAASADTAAPDTAAPGAGASRAGASRAGPSGAGPSDTAPGTVAPAARPTPTGVPGGPHPSGPVEHRTARHEGGRPGPTPIGEAPSDGSRPRGATLISSGTVPVVASLSPSRAADFVTCPLRYRFRVIDRLPEPPGEAATRGTVVHAVLERLFDLPPRGRTLPAAAELLEPVWAELVAREPALADLFADDQALRIWLDSARDLLAGYFTLEDPTRLAPAARELYVEHVLESGLRLRGYVDRLDEAETPAGTALRVVDYKTGRSPGPAFETSAMFQMRFYALLLWRIRGVVPRELRLYYLGDRTWLRATPDESELRATERRIEALWAAIARAHRTGDWRATPGRLCDWCDHKARCPAFGGTPPPLPSDAAEPSLDDAAPAVCESDG